MSYMFSVNDTYVMVLLVTRNKNKMICSFVVSIINFECEFIWYQTVFGNLIISSISFFFLFFLFSFFFFLFLFFILVSQNLCNKKLKLKSRNQTSKTFVAVIFLPGVATCSSCSEIWFTFDLISSIVD